MKLSYMTYLVMWHGEFTQAQLAEKIGSNQTTVHYILHGFIPNDQKIIERIHELFLCYVDNTQREIDLSLDPLAAKCKETRKREGLSQQDFAKLVGTTRWVIEFVERGYIPLEFEVVDNIEGLWEYHHSFC